MKKISSILLTLALPVLTMAQLEVPKASPNAEVEQVIGLTEVEVSYSRPGVKGRIIFGDLVPFGEVWRTGANKATTIEFADTLYVNQDTVAPGEYAIFTIPGEKSWTVVFNSNADQSGTSNYDTTLNVLSLEVKPAVLKDTVETLTFDFQNITMNTADLVLKWETTAVAIPLKFEVDRTVERNIRIALDAELQWSTYYNSAKYYYNTGKDLDQALQWVNESIKYKDDAYWIYNLKAEILLAKEMYSDAIETAKKALEFGGEGYQKRYDNIVRIAKAKK